MCQHTLPDQHTLIRDKLEECEKLATQSLENLRNLTSDLRPPILDHFGLVSTIRWYIDSFKLRTNLKIKVKIPKLTYKFPPEFETTIYRIIQEGLTNVAKHSQAERASISLYKKGNNVRIIIQDNGIGFELENLPHVHGFGLFRMKENTELLGGKFKIISNKGRGTKLDIALPCEEKN
jgi:signal transduction histidine kinase